MEILSLPPNAPILMEATRAIGYSLETALADIIDNSITADATKIDILFFPMGSPYVAITDNGHGMDQEELINAMRYGSKNPLDTRTTNDLGRFGLGMKTASMSQCRKLSVVSLKDEIVTGAQWDLDFIATTNDWSLKLLDNDELQALPHFSELLNGGNGTMVIWQELDRLKVGELNFNENMGKYMDRVRDHLSLVFHRYLSGEVGVKKIQISINKVYLESIDPFLSGKSTQVMDEENVVINGQKIVVRPYTLPHISMLSQAEIKMLGGDEGLRKLQGFYIYRNKRLLVWGTWFRLMRQGELSKLARVRVDIPNSLDYLWTLDIKKSVAIPPEIVRKNLAPIVEKLAGSSKRTWTYRGKKETEDSKIHIWDRFRTREGGIVYEINRGYPLIEAMNKSEKDVVEQLLIQIELGLPLNQLYVDLTSDERVLNEKVLTKTDLLPMLNQMFSGCSSDQERREMAERLSITEPFDQNPEWLYEFL
ncbi:ATP-binding protein [Paenibacillus odorifer]|uniref:ATP-binding protein n=1 Tax=Paenibacillus odorifer TaxID=189426 RepID=UPI00096FABA6|nr:ATP-binding protein [Paenibacillus odorifer]OME30919.1 ATP-binding protein [Paenibacillus odorifer]OME31229.1 ATP-binding protein [Paenibacillus odorifer]